MNGRPTGGSTLGGLLVLLVLLAMPTTAAHARGDHLWNLRENADDRFHDNDSYIRPWRTSFDDGVGRWVGNHSYEIPWGSTSTTGDGTGAFHLSRGSDHQWHAWTYVLVTHDRMVTVNISDGDCVPRLYWDTDFDSPQIIPASRLLSAGIHRIDICGYNQNSGYNVVIPPPLGIDDMDHTPNLPCGPADLVVDGRVDLLDFFYFFNCFDTTATCADIDGEPGVDLGDFFFFLNAFDAGC